MSGLHDSTLKLQLGGRGEMGETGLTRLAHFYRNGSHSGYFVLQAIFSPLTGRNSRYSGKYRSFCRGKAGIGAMISVSFSKVRIFAK
ncbi:hypothetical protein J25TS5_47790 [Paenibacillus faecis]|nr:hypothetical protein J25TS5_47790 [Paenibacillus faecis]